MLQLRSNPGPTGRMINQMLRERNLLGEPVQAVVNYGYGGPTELPCLNRKAGTFNKLQELEMLRAKGVQTVPFSRSPMGLSAPLMGRSLHHTRGNDIIVYRVRPYGLNETGPRVTFGNLVPHDFFTQLIPKAQEFRVWAFRRKVIGVYEKCLEYPNKLGRRGRSREVWYYRHGYSYIFRKASEADPSLKQLAIASVDAVGLDFGAADIIRGTNNQFFVLEVNSAPGVEGRRQGISSLVNHIQRWAEGGFKRRNGEERMD